jgi:PKD repeat protein
VVYVDFWGWGSDPYGEQSYLTNFLAGVGGTSWLSSVNQYGGGSNVRLGGTWSDGTSIPSHPTDSQIQAEASRAVSHFGAGSSVNVEIVVATPTGHYTSGFGTQWCAYHGANPYNPNTTYTNLPYMTDAGSSCGAGSVTGNALDGVSIVEGHELAETITDPLLNAWYDPVSDNEDGDNCNAYGAFNPASGRNPNAFLPSLGGSASTGTLYNQKINNDPYYIQSEWSNGDGTCKMKPAAATLAARFTQPSGPNAVGTTLNFDPSASSSSAGLTSVSWNLGDGSAPVFSPGGSLAPVAHTYTGVAKYNVTLTLVDSRGNVSTNTQQVVVGQPPNAVFTFSPGQTLPGGVVTFDGSASNDPLTTLVSYSWSFGDGATASGVTASHAYASPGSYTVTLKVTDTAGNSDAISQAVTVDAPPPPVPPPATIATAHPALPLASFVVKTRHPTAGLAVAFDGSSSVGAITKYHWTFGDGSKRAWGAVPSHVYRRPGTYSVTFTVTDITGASATIVKTVTVGRAAAITKVAVRRRRGRPSLMVAVSGPGSVSAFRKTIRLRRSGTARFALRLTRAQVQALAVRRTITIRVALRFAPLAGRQSSRRLAIKIHAAPRTPARFAAALAR